MNRPMKALEPMKALDGVARWLHHREKGALWGLAAVGVAAVGARVAVVLLSTGSNDIFTWFQFVVSIRDDGLIETYRRIQGFNHPPLMGLYARLAGEVNLRTGAFFPYVYKIGPVVADLGVAALLWRFWRARGRSAVEAAAIVCAYLWSPIAILVAAYHGNTDSILAAAMLAAAVTAIGGRSPFVAGLVLGAAINVKIVAVFLIPPLWAQQRGRRSVVRYGSGLAVAALPFVPVLLLAGREFYRNAIAYNSSLEHWGVQLMLLQGEQMRHVANLAATAVDVYSAAGRWIILGASLAMAALGRRGARINAVEAAALTMAGFLLLTPGFGIQYAVWVVPLLFAVAPRSAVAYSLVGGAFAFAVYLSYWTGTWPARSVFINRYAMAPALFGFWAWLVLLRFVRARLAAALWPPAPPTGIPDADDVARRSAPEQRAS